MTQYFIDFGNIGKVTNTWKQIKSTQYAVKWNKLITKWSFDITTKIFFQAKYSWIVTPRNNPNTGYIQTWTAAPHLIASLSSWSSAYIDNKHVNNNMCSLIKHAGCTCTFLGSVTKTSYSYNCFVQITNLIQMTMNPHPPGNGSTE